MNKRIVEAVLAAALLFLAGCVKEITSDERLDRETARSDALTSTTAGELLKLRCDDIDVELAQARDATRAEDARLAAYVQLYEQVKSRTARFEEALSRNPDLNYQEGSQQIIGARDGCVKSQADVRLDLEGLVREVMQMPTVEEIRNNSTVKVARLDFEALRTAITRLDLDDKDTLLNKLNNAERLVESKDPKKKK